MFGWQFAAIHHPTQQHSLRCAQQHWEASSLNRNSHLVNFTDAVCRHQWTVADNVVQSAGHNLYENIQCCSRLHNHSVQLLFFCFSIHHCVAYFDAIFIWAERNEWMTWVANTVAVGSFIQTSNLFSIRSLSTSVMRRWQSGPQSSSSHSLCQALPWCITSLLFGFFRGLLIVRMHTWF